MRPQAPKPQPRSAQPQPRPQPGTDFPQPDSRQPATARGITGRACWALCVMLAAACSGGSRDLADGDDEPGPRGGEGQGRADSGTGRVVRDSGPEDAGSSSTAAPEARFSFFVASYRAMQRLSRSEAGFGGDLRYGEADGLAGADKICREIAETSLPGAGKKTWRAFLSVTRGPDGQPVHAIDRIGPGPWHDRRGRLVAPTLADLMNTRPQNGDPAIVDDLPNEDGVPNHAPDGELVDNHDILTGSDRIGRLYKNDPAVTCQDWTSAVGSAGRPRVGHSWPRGLGDFGGLFGDGGFPFPFPTGGDGGFPFPFPTGGDGGLDFASFDGESWASALDEAGCAPGASLVEMGPPDPRNPTVGSGGGYGGIYCFAVK